MEVTKRIRVRCYTIKEAEFIMLFLVKNGFEGETYFYRNCCLFAQFALDTDGVCFVGIALSRGASMRVSNLHDSVARKDYIEVSKSKFISEITKFKLLLRKPWKDGDILIHNNCPHCYAVFKKYKDNDAFEAYFILDHKDAFFDATAFVEHYHFAYTKEIESLPLLFTFLMGALNEAGLCLPKNVERNPLPDNETKRLEEGDD